jgi:hypothetical protein
MLLILLTEKYGILSWQKKKEKSGKAPPKKEKKKRLQSLKKKRPEKRKNFIEPGRVVAWNLMENQQVEKSLKNLL